MTTTAFIRLAGTFAAVCLLPAAAFAADAHAAGGESKNILAPDIVNSVVTLIVFGALLAILYVFAWGPIMKGLQAREESQFQAINEAKKAKEEAAAMRAQLDVEKAKAAVQVRELMEQARKDAEALKATEKEAGEREAQTIMERAKRDASLALEGHRKELQAEAIQLAMMIATKALRRQVTVENQHELLKESIAELNGNAASKA